MEDTMLEKIPWESHYMMFGYPYVLSLTKDMTWKDHGTVEVKTGHMSINTAEVEKLYVRYMLGTTVWDL